MLRRKKQEFATEKRQIKTRKLLQAQNQKFLVI